MMGAYQCVCNEGFKQATSGTSCVDIDECGGGGNGGCDDICINTQVIMCICTKVPKSKTDLIDVI